MRLNTKVAYKEPHPALAPLLSRYQDNMTTPKEAEQVERHLLECEACRSFYGVLQEARALISNQSLVFEQPNEQDLQRILQRTVYPDNRRRAKKILKKEGQK